MISRAFSQPASPSSSPSSSPPTPPKSNLTVDLSQRILLNTPIACAICPTGDRWLFFQDQKNNVRAAIQSPGSTWNFHTSTIPSTARPGSPLSASCITLSSSSTVIPDAITNVVVAGSLVFKIVAKRGSTALLTQNRQVSLVFFDKHALLGQSYYNDGSWHSVSTSMRNQSVAPLLAAVPLSSGFSAFSPPPSIPASANSRLSISTYILPAIVANGSDSYFPIQNNSFVAPADLLSSVAIYQANDTPVMVDLVGTTQRDLPSNTLPNNLFTQFTFYEEALLVLMSQIDVGGLICQEPSHQGDMHARITML